MCPGPSYYRADIGRARAHRTHETHVELGPGPRELVGSGHDVKVPARGGEGGKVNAGVPAAVLGISVPPKIRKRQKVQKKAYMS